MGHAAHPLVRPSIHQTCWPTTFPNAGPGGLAVALISIVSIFAHERSCHVEMLGKARGVKGAKMVKMVNRGKEVKSFGIRVLSVR